MIKYASNGGLHSFGTIIVGDMIVLSGSVCIEMNMPKRMGTDFLSKDFLPQWPSKVGFGKIIMWYTCVITSYIKSDTSRHSIQNFVCMDQTLEHELTATG